MNIAVTGASGFLGKILLPLLSEQGHIVVPVDRKAGWDICNWEEISGLPAMDLVIHMAAQSYIPEAYQNPRGFYDTNVNGTLNMLEVARKAAAKFIFISSYAYGHPQYLPIDEAHPVAAVNPYGQSKLLGEELCQAYHRDFGLDVTILRPFNIYGSGQADHFLIPKILRMAADRQEIELFDPRPKRDYIEVRDMASAILAAVKNQAAGCHIFNIGSGESYGIPEVIEILRPFFDHDLEVKYLNKFRPDEIMDTKCNNGKAAKELGWAPAISLKQGLQDMVASLKQIQ